MVLLFQICIIMTVDMAAKMHGENLFRIHPYVKSYRQSKTAVRKRMSFLQGKAP